MRQQMKRFQSSARGRASLNLTPLLDVLLVLVVIMLLVMTMFNKQLPVTLPVSDVNGVPVIAQSVRLSVAPDGTLLQEFSPISAESLASQVNSSVTIELAVDKAVTYQVITSHIAQLQKLQPKTIALVTK